MAGRDADLDLDLDLNRDWESGHWTPEHWTPAHVRLHGVLRSRPLLPTGQRLLIALSGGQDSLCLAKLLLDLRSRWHWTLAIAHCNHRWRTDADANAQHVQDLADRWQLPCWTNTAAEPPQNESQARAWRYDVLTEIAVAEGFDAVVTGHTASDRAETLLYNLVRGSGADGLGALTWERPLAIRTHMDAQPIRLVRPLLGFTRSETATFCQQHQLPIWEDTTNQSRDHARNRLRLDVLPYLQQHLNPRVEEHLARTAELLQADVAYLEEQAIALLAQVEFNPAQSDPAQSNPVQSNPVQSSPVQTNPVQTNPVQSEPVQSNPAPPKLQRRQLHQAPLALQRRVIRQFLRQHLPRQPNGEQIDKLVALLAAPNRSQSDPLPGGAIARVFGDWLSLEKSP